MVTSSNPQINTSSDISNYTPIAQSTFPYNIIHEQMFEQFTFGGGSLSVDDGVANIAIGTGVGDYALIRTKRVLKYKSGCSIKVQLAAKFDTPVANSLQMVGVGTAARDIYIGYSGTDFVARVSYNGHAEIRTLTITTPASGTETFTLVLNGVTYTGTITAVDDHFNAYEILSTNTYAGWNCRQLGNTIVFTSSAVGAKSGAYSFSSSGVATATLAQNQAGIALTTVNTIISNFNGQPRAIRIINPTDWNLYEIEYGGGMSNITFRVFDELNACFNNLHTYLASTVSVQPIIFSSPGMFIQRYVASIGSSTALTMLTGQNYAGYLGLPYPGIRPRYSIDPVKTLVSATELNLISLKHLHNLNNVLVIDETIIDTLSISCVGSDAVYIKIILNPTTIGNGTSSDYPDYNYVDLTDSISMYEITSKTYTGGELFMTHIVPPGVSSIDLTDLVLNRNDVLLITATSSSSADVSICIMIQEDIG